MKIPRLLTRLWRLDVTNATAILSYSIVSTTTGTGNLTYKNSFAHLKRGSLNQLPYNELYGIPSASYILGSNQDLTWYGNGVGGTASATIVQSSAFSFGQNSKEEIDELKVQIEFPAGLQLIGGTGESRYAHAEFQIILQYKTSPNQASFTKRLVWGNDYGGSEFIDSLKSGQLHFWNLGDGETSDSYDKFDQYKDFYMRSKDARYRGQGSTTSNGTPSGESGRALIQKKGQNTAFVSEFSISLKDLQPLHDWQIEVRRISPDNVRDYTYANNSFISSARLKLVEAIIEEKFSFPRSAYAVVGFAAEDFAQPPSRAYHLRGKKIRIPNNYFTREELGTYQAEYTRNTSTGVLESAYQPWTGGFRQELVYTNNPAWVFYDILTNKEYGLGDFIQDSDIDIYSLYQIARYCDEVVPDGKGGLEPRFACNVYLNSQEESYKVLKDLASTFRSMMFWIDGKITAIQDKPKEPVYTFTQGNVEDGLFNYSYTGQRARTNQVNATWTDPDQFYAQTTITVDDTANMISQGRIVSKDVVAFGCTSEGQARRLAAWHLATDTTETEIVSFTTSMNASFLRPGDVINIQDRQSVNFEASGRLSTGSTTTSIVLDRTVDFPGSGTLGTGCNLYLIFTEPSFFLQQETATINSQTYSRGAVLLEDKDANPLISEEQGINLLDDSGDVVLVQYNKNSRVEVKAITNSTTSASTISVSGAFSTAPAQDTIWAISREDDVNSPEIREFRIAGITEEDGFKYSIAATQYTREKFDEIDIDSPVYTTTYVSEAGRNSPPPAVASISIELVTDGSSSEEASGTATKARISWTPAVESYTDSNGLVSTRPYRFLKGYEVVHNLTTTNNSIYADDTARVFVPASSNVLEIDNVSAGTYTVGIITKSDSEPSTNSVTTSVTRTIFTAPPQVSKLSRLSKGGFITSPISFNSSTALVVLENAIYSYSPPSGIDYFSTAGSPLFNQQSFISLADGGVAYLLYDASSAESGGDPWKAIQLHIDNIAEDPSSNITRTTYVKELGASNNGLTAISGTVETFFGSDTITGSGTSFTTDFSVGDFIKVSSGSAAGTEVASSEYREIVEIFSNTAMTVKFPFLRTQSGVYGFKQTFVPDISKDVILAEISRSGSVYSADIYVQTKGDDGYVVNFTNEAVSLAAGIDETVSPIEFPVDGYTNTGTVVKVSKGSTLLSATSGIPGPGEFNVTVNAVTNIVAGAITHSGTTATVAEASTMSDTQDEASIEFLISVEGLVTFTKQQTFTKAIRGKRGAGRWNVPVSTLPSTSSLAEAAWQAWANSPGAAVYKDQAWFFLGTEASPTAQAVWVYVGSGTWTQQNEIVDGSLLISGSVETGSLAAGSITTGKLAANSVVTDTIASNSVVTSTIASNSIITNSIVSNSVIADTIAANSVTTDILQANSVIADTISANSVTTDILQANSVITDTISANSVTTDILQANSVITDTISANSVTSKTIAAESVTTNSLVSNAINSNILQSNSVEANTIASNAITSRHISSGSITTETLDAFLITTEKLAANAVNADKIAANSITTNELIANSVFAENIVANTITTELLAANSITTNRIAANQINSDKIAANSITTNLIAANQITTNSIAANSITSDSLATNSVNADTIASNSITTLELTVGAVTADTIAANAITSNKIAANAITVEELSANSVTANTIAANSITADSVSANSIVATLLNANKINTNDIAANGVTADIIAANSVRTTEIAANSVNASKIVSNSITTELLAANSITANNLAANSVTANTIAANSITADSVSANSIVATLLNAQKVFADDVSVNSLAAVSANIGDITAGTLKGGNIPEANSAPTSGEAGAFLDLTAGKMIFGNDSKYVWFDGTDLILSGVTIDANSIVNASASMQVQDNGGTATEVDDLNFGTNLGVTISGTDPVIATIDGLSDSEIRGLFSGGTGITLSTGSFSLDFSELADMVADVAATTEFILQNGTIESRKPASEIKLSVFNNDANFSSTTGTVTSVATTGSVNGITLTGTVTSSGTLTLGGALSGITVSQLADAAYQTSAEAFVDNDTSLMTSAAIEDKILAYGYSTTTGTVTSVATTGSVNGITLTGGTITGSGTLTLGGALSGITVSQLADAAYQTSAEAFADNDTSLMTSAAINDRILAISSNNTGTVTSVATTGSVNGITLTGTVTSSGTLTLGGALSGITVSQLADAAYQTSAEAFADNDTSLMTSAAINDLILSKSYSTTTGTVTSVSGSGAISVTDGTTTPTVSVATASGSAAGIVSTGTQAFAGDKTFNNSVIVSGDLTVSGTTTTVNTEEILLADNIITLNSNFSGTSPSESAGLEIERGDEANSLFQWKESGVGETGDLDKGWSFGTARVEATGFYGTFYGDATGLTGVTAADLTGLSTADLAEDPSATVSSGTMYYTDARAQAAITAGNGLGKSVGTLSVGEGSGISVSATSVAVDSTVLRTSGNFGIAGDFTFADNAKAIFGTDSDLQIYHDELNSYISDQGTGHLKILAGDFRLNNAADDAQFISAVNGAEVNLYHNNSPRLSTTSTGIDVTGTINASGNVAITGTVTGSNLSGTNTGDETQSSINGLAITEVGTIATGVWNGTIIAEAYLQNQSGTNTGDETLASINALDITEVGTITSGTWNGAIIAEAYLQNQSGTNTGDETLASINALDITEVGTITSGTWNGAIIAEAYLQNQSGTNTGDEPAASATVAGIVELATIAETNTGTDATRAVTPDGLDGWTGSTSLTTLGTITGRLTVTDATAGDGGWVNGILIENTGTGGEAAIAFKNSVTGSNYFIAGLNQDANFAFNYGTSFTDSANKLTITSDGKVGINGVPDPTFNLQVNGSFAATTKSFLIDHPTQPGKKLRYGSLEGPENGVYVRGKLSENETIIELPEYWTNLIDEDSITVNLTPIGRGETWVESIENNQITVGKTTECFYTVFAERKDVEKLIVEE